MVNSADSGSQRMSALLIQIVDCLDESNMEGHFLRGKICCISSGYAGSLPIPAVDKTTGCPNPCLRVSA